MARPLGSPAGISLCEHLEADGEVVFRHACKMGLEGPWQELRWVEYHTSFAAGRKARELISARWGVPAAAVAPDAPCQTCNPCGGGLDDPPDISRFRPICDLMLRLNIKDCGLCDL
jgi:hypothetical protein